MRKVIYLVANSLDNFIARPDGAVDWLSNDGTDYGMAAFFKSVDTLLLGRKTYEVSLRLAAAESRKRKGGKSQNPFAGADTYVFSRTLKRVEYEGVRIVSEDAGGFVRGLKQGAGKDIWLMGGGELAGSLLSEGLVDEIGLNVHPVLLGAGVPLFAGLDRQVDMELLDCKRHANGCVQVAYRVKN